MGREDLELRGFLVETSDENVGIDRFDQEVFEERNRGDVEEGEEGSVGEDLDG